MRVTFRWPMSAENRKFPQRTLWASVQAAELISSSWRPFTDKLGSGSVCGRFGCCWPIWQAQWNFHQKMIFLLSSLWINIGGKPIAYSAGERPKWPLPFYFIITAHFVQRFLYISLCGRFLFKWPVQLAPQCAQSSCEPWINQFVVPDSLTVAHWPQWRCQCKWTSVKPSSEQVRSRCKFRGDL